MLRSWTKLEIDPCQGLGKISRIFSSEWKIRSLYRPSTVILNCISMECIFDLLLLSLIPPRIHSHVSSNWILLKSIFCCCCFVLFVRTCLASTLRWGVFPGWRQRCHCHHHGCPEWEGSCFLILLSTSAINPVDFICLLSSLRNCLVFRRADGLPFYSTAFAGSAQVGMHTFIVATPGLHPPCLSATDSRFPQDIWLLREQEKQSH